MKLHSIKRRLALFCVNRIFAGTRAFCIKRKLLRETGWEIGARATHGRSICLGDGSVIAACACVISANMLAGGVLAKTIRELEA